MPSPRRERHNHENPAPLKRFRGLNLTTRFSPRRLRVSQPRSACLRRNRAVADAGLLHDVGLHGLQYSLPKRLRILLDHQHRTSGGKHDGAGVRSHATISVEEHDLATGQLAKLHTFCRRHGDAERVRRQLAAHGEPLDPPIPNTGGPGRDGRRMTPDSAATTGPPENVALVPAKPASAWSQPQQRRTVYAMAEAFKIDRFASNVVEGQGDGPMQLLSVHVADLSPRREPHNASKGSLHRLLGINRKDANSAIGAWR